MSHADFWIYPKALRYEAGAYTGCANLIGKAKERVVGFPCLIPTSHKPFTPAAEQANDLLAALMVFFDHTDDVLRGIARQLNDTADEADDIDMQTAADLDAYSPTEYNDFDPDAPEWYGAGHIAPRDERLDDMEGTVPPLNDRAGGIGLYFSADGTNAGFAEPETHLIPDNLLSPSEWIATVLGWIGATSLKDELLKLFGGRWGELVEFKDLLVGSRKLLDAVDSNTKAVATALASHYWQGYSADSAQEYFSLLHDRLSDASVKVGDAADKFVDYLDAVDEAFDLISGDAYSIMDWVLVAVAGLIVGTATAEEGVGLIALGASGISALWVKHQVTELYKSIGTAKTLYTMLDMLKGLPADLSSVTDALHIPEMVET